MMRIEAFLKQSLLFEVMRASRGFDRHIGRIFQAEELNFLAALVLVSVFFEYPETITPSRLAETLGATRGNISHCVSFLESQGFIQRRIHPADARSFHLLLRPRGKKCAIEAIRIYDKMQKDFETQIGPVRLSSSLDTIRHAEQICADIAHRLTA